MNRLSELEALKAAFAFQCALIANGNLVAESFKEAQERGRTLYHQILDILQPWATDAEAEAHLGKIGGLMDAYRQIVGDPNDPEVQKKLAEAAVILERRAQEAPPETEDERVTRLIRARDAERRRKGL